MRVQTLSKQCCKKFTLHVIASYDYTAAVGILYNL